MSVGQTHTIRPAGRHILTIGRDLIQDQYAAIVELVKNAYDADSPAANVTFRLDEKTQALTITVKDNGHGMSRDTIIDKWLVPSTDDKFQRKSSPNGRTMQGRKGVGRYAASILGNDLLLETITDEGEKNTVYIEWKHFEDAKFLSDVEILIDTTSTNLPSGTSLTIVADKQHFVDWDEKQIRKLEFELKKLVSPVAEEDSEIDTSDEFSIFLEYKDFFADPENNNIKKIKPFPVFNLYDYKISGVIDSDGTGELTYFIQKAKNTVDVTIPINLGSKTGCGSLKVDIRVYDREAPSIEQLISRGLKDDKGNYVGKREARNLLNQYNGIGVYRNGFRIRPLGDPEFDWLSLNKRRVQNPSLCIGSDQAIGYIQIESEETSNLEEKSARDGLKENEAYESLKKIVLETVIRELEIRRFQYRNKAGLSRHTVKVEKELERLFSFDSLREGIRKKLTKSGVDKDTANDIIEIISKEEQEKTRIVDDIRQTVAIYQGQATLGKIINVVLHEGRRPLNFFKNQIPNLNFWAKELKENYEPETLNELIPIAEGLGQNADAFVKLFGRLDPLASGKRGKRKDFDLKKSITGAFKVFENELLENKITHEISADKDVPFHGWTQDIYVIITNLIDNSIFWMVEKKSTNRKISVEISNSEEGLNFIDYHDSGPGIEKHLIENEVIFEPEFSTKSGGTGLGLAIAGEAASRNKLHLKAFDCKSGAYFRLQPSRGE
jgi:signal transduction histidine kinase